MNKEFLEAGKIVNTHGVKGEIKIQPWANSPEFLLEPEHIYINKKPCKILSARVHKGMLIAELEGISDINDAMKLKNSVVYIRRDDVELDEGEFFIQDIIGSSVFSESGDELGLLDDVMELPGGNVYVVKGEREILIPAVPEFIISTDAKGKKIVVRLIEGM